jgi:ABC-type dipeptide/oligopeptide/nickel transport system permease component
MGWYVARRLVASVLVLLFVTIITFTTLKLAPGNELLARMSPEALSSLTPQQLAQDEKALGLNLPFPVQYWRWLDSTVHGNLGYSSAQGVSVWSLLRSHIGPTVLLMGVALLVALLVAVPLGVIAAVRHRSRLDYAVSTLPILMIGVPGFVLCLLAIFFFAVNLGVLPVAGMHTPGVSSLGDLASHIVLPALILSIGFGAPILRYTRASMLDTLSSEYVVTARSKGLSSFAVVFRHAFRNALLPLITVIGLSLADVVSGAVIVETIFNWPGMGNLAVTAANDRDMPVMLGIVLLVAVAVTIANLVADLAYAWADPRVRLA